MYAITGATGNIGQVIAERLLEKGKKVRAIGRSSEKLQHLVAKGAEAVITDLKDSEALTKAFTGVTAVYAMIPSNPTAEDFRADQNQVGKSIADAITRAGVKNVVNLSSVGAHLGKGTGAINGLHDQEERLNALEGVNVLHLRPTYFLENHFSAIPTLKEHGMMAVPHDPDKPMAQICTSDIAEYATERLLNLDFEGKTSRELLGAADITLNDVAGAIGRELGKNDLKYTRISHDDARNYLRGAGLSEDTTETLIEMYKAFDNPEFGPTENRTPENTTPTTAEQFSKTFAAVYKK